MFWFLLLRHVLKIERTSDRWSVESDAKDDRKIGEIEEVNIGRVRGLYTKSGLRRDFSSLESSWMQPKLWQDVKVLLRSVRNSGYSWQMRNFKMSGSVSIKLCKYSARHSEIRSFLSETSRSSEKSMSPAFKKILNRCFIA